MVIEVRDAPVPVRWRWQGCGWIEGQRAWFMDRGISAWRSFSCMPLTVELSNGQVVIVRAKK